jgi:uncharacterized protein YraI
MRITSMISTAALTTAALLSGPASAATLATATTALNIRSGPGPQYNVVGVIKDRGQARMLGCIEGSLWCQVDYHGRQGWAYSKYLTTQVAGQPLMIAGNTAQIGVPPVTYQVPAVTTVETVGSAVPPAPAVAGTLIERPVAATQYVVNPPPTVRTYVIQHPAQQVYLNGEVVVGAGLPEDVALQPVPDSDYEYAYINRVPVLVQPQTRRIVYIYR